MKMLQQELAKMQLVKAKYALNNDIYDDEDDWEEVSQEDACQYDIQEKPASLKDIQNLLHFTATVNEQSDAAKLI